MPVYDFTCPECGDFRALLTIDERNDPTPCPDARGSASGSSSRPISR